MADGPYSHLSNGWREVCELLADIRDALNHNNIHYEDDDECDPDEPVPPLQREQLFSTGP